MASGCESSTEPTRSTSYGLLALAIASVCVLEWALVVHSGLLDAAPTMDESFTTLTVRSAPESLVRGIRSDPGMASYYTTLTLWSELVGSDLRDLRLFSVVCFGMVAGGMCLAAWSVRRLLWGWLAAIAFGSSLAAREAVIDARAAIFAAALTLIALCLLQTLERRVSFPRVVAAGAVLIGLAWAHPSALILALAGTLLLLQTTRSGPRRLQVATIVAALAELPVLAASALQIGASHGLARPGLEGVRHVLSSYVGGHWVIAIALLAICVALAAVCRGRDFAARTCALAGAGWFVGALVILPLTNLMLPRYFVASAAAVAAGLGVVRARGSLGAMATAGLIAAVAGGLSVIAQAPRQPSEWCQFTAALDEVFETGDTLAFTDPIMRSPVVVCLDDRAQAFFERGTILPQTSAADLSDPRSLWTYSGADPLAGLEEQPDRRRILAWEPSTAKAARDVLERLRLRGAHCEDTSVPSGLAFAVCHRSGVASEDHVSSKRKME